MITKEKLKEINYLLAEKSKMLGTTTKDMNEKHNIRIQRMFIKKITVGDVEKYVDILKKELRRE